jgi:endonuclease YncB( thermonuclease family)
MLSLKHQVESQKDTSLPRWNMGIDRRQVVMYVAIAIIGGFAAGLITYKYTAATNKQPEPIPATTEEAAARAGVTPLVDHPDSPTSQFHVVSRVIRADIVEVEEIGPVQMIGVETPDGKTPAEIYQVHGRKAREFTERSLVGQKVRLEFDPANAGTNNKAPSGQTLAYIYTQDGTLLNGELIRQGHAFVRVAEQFRLIEEFRRLEREAMQALAGVWGLSGAAPAASSLAASATPVPGTKDEKKDEKNDKKRLSPMLPSELGPNIPATSSPISPSEPSVFISTGDRTYHRADCEYLSKKRQAIPLSQAKGDGYTSCSRCYASTVLKAR